MTERYISAVGGYLPLLRFDRGAGTKALRFAGLGGRGGGRRAVAGWDEDAVTLAVEAARALTLDAAPDRLVFASTSAPFLDRSQATLVASALGWPTSIRTTDVAGTRRCAVSALADGLLAPGRTAVAAGERRAARPGSAQHLGHGDGAAAAVADDRGSARLIGHAALSHDLLDSYVAAETGYPYAYEERFVRETTAREVLVPTIRAACAAAGVDAGAVRHAAVHEPLPGSWRDVAGPLGIGAGNHAATLEAAAGDLGAAHALYALALALDAARPGELVLLAGFGSGCDAMLFEATGPVPGAADAAAALKQGLAFADYVRLLSLTEAVELDFGVRAEFEQKAQATVIERHGRDAIGFVGGRDSAGNVQFPKSRVPVRPGAEGAEPMRDVRLAEVPAAVVSVTADRLNYTPDPPFWFGLVQFENGARVLMEMTDAGPAGFAVGDSLAMRLRIKSRDRRRGLRTYFWKAAPAARPALED